jgi:hypothetical protein
MLVATIMACRAYTRGTLQYGAAAAAIFLFSAATRPLAFTLFSVNGLLLVRLSSHVRRRLLLLLLLLLLMLTA